MTSCGAIRSVLCGAIAFCLVVGCTSITTSPTASTTTENRIATLSKQIAQQEGESVQAVADYVPTSDSRINDLNLPLDELLRQLPDVVQVEVGVKGNKATNRIVHLRDWHFVPKELFVLDMKEVHGRDLADEEIDRHYREFLLEVELVQIEQMTVLRCLIKYLGLKKVFSEGFSQSELEAYRERIAVLKAMDQKQIPKFKVQLEAVRQLLVDLSGDEKEKAESIEAQLLTTLNDHKHRLLEVGSAGRLLIAEEIEDVLPLEDADAMENANPISSSGSVMLDVEKIEARHDAQVKLVMKERPVAVIVLGGSHDLTESVRRVGGNCEYLRVTTKKFKEIAE